MNTSFDTTSTREELGPIVEATVIVADLAASTEAYTEGFGWDLRESAGVLSAPHAELLDSRLEGRHFAIVGPPAGSASVGGVRLIEVTGVESLKPLRTHGWSALEVGVIDVATATKRAKEAGWKVLFTPLVLGAGKLPLIAAQIAGPSGEAVYLTQILGPVAGFALPVPVKEVDGVFIVVLGASSLNGSREVIEDRFATKRVSDHELPIRVLNKQYGYPMDTLHRISSLQLRGRTCIEVDQLPADALPRLTNGELPAGILSVALEVSSAVPAERVVLPDGAFLELRPAPAEH